jgi:hypothetical protein
MAAKPETTFTASVDRHLPKNLHKEKMFNPYRGGTFDKWYSGTNGDVWVEYKFVVIPKRPTTLITPGLSELQLLWGRSRAAEGRNVMVIVGSKAGGVVMTDPKEWDIPISAKEFLARLYSREALAGEILNITGAPPCLNLYS